MYTNFVGLYFMNCRFYRFVFLNLWFLAIVLSYPLCLNILSMKLVQAAADLQSCERKTPCKLKCLQYFIGGPVHMWVVVRFE